MAISWSPTNLIASDTAPEGVVTAKLGTVLVQISPAMSTLWVKGSETVAGTDDNTGWARIANGNNISAVSAWFPPVTPHAWNDEFDNGVALDASWAVSVGQIVATAIDPNAAFAGAGDCRVSHNLRRPGWFMVQPATAGAFGFTKSTPFGATDFALFARSSYNHRAPTAALNNDFSHAIVCTTEPYDSNNILLMQLNESDAGVIQAEFSQVVAGVGTSIGVSANITPSDHTPFEGCVIQKTAANTYRGYVITNNGSAIYLGQTTTFTPAVARSGFLCSNVSSVAPGNMIMGFDFFRVFTQAVSPNNWPYLP